MLEKDLEKKVVQRARELGYLTRKFSSPSHRGDPDRIFITPSGHLFFVEFKSYRGKLTEFQKFQIEELRDFKQTVYVVNDLHQGFHILNNEI